MRCCECILYSSGLFIEQNIYNIRLNQLKLKSVLKNNTDYRTVMILGSNKITRYSHCSVIKSTPLFFWQQHNKHTFSITLQLADAALFDWWGCFVYAKLGFLCSAEKWLKNNKGYCLRNTVMNLNDNNATVLRLSCWTIKADNLSEFMTAVVITPIWARDAAVCQSDGPTHYGMNEIGELCGSRV